MMDGAGGSAGSAGAGGAGGSGGPGGPGGPGGSSPGRRLSEREVWDRWLWGGLGVLGVLVLASVTGMCSVDLQRPAPGGPPWVPELPAAVELDRPLLPVDVRGETRAAMRILALEDARAPNPGEEAELVQFLEHRDSGIRRMAVRALGRLERATLVEAMARGLSDPVPVVRIEAANAVAQGVHRAGAAETDEALGVAEAALLAALETETEAAVRGALAQALGRLPAPEGAPAGQVLDAFDGRVALLVAVLSDDAEEARLGAARGALALVRAPQARLPGAEGARAALADALRSLLVLGPPVPQVAPSATSSAVPAGAPAPASDLVRRAAAAAWASIPAVDRGASPALADPSPEVRRILAGAAGAAGALGSGDPDVLEGALADPDPSVRIEGVRGWARHLGATRGCGPVIEAARDPADAVALVALEALGRPPCAPASDTPGMTHAALALLREVAAALPDDPDASPSWHRPVRALQALARVDPAGAAPLLDAAARYPDPFVRAHVARTPGVSTSLLEALAADPHANVREAALGPLADRGDAAFPRRLAEALALDDPQLARTVSRLAPGVADPPLVAALFASLERFEAAGRATDHDAREALRGALAALGESVPASAGRAGELPLPTWGELLALSRGEVVLTLDRGGLEAPSDVRIRLLPLEAPTNAARMARLAADGTLDGLTLHRVVPNFVIQGGSPGANEYAGHGAWTRDEVGRIGHWQGTVGLSTRGRDTGDGQLFVNLVDNLRLGHDYTVFGVVTQGLDALVAAQEGVRIVRARWDVGEVQADGGADR